MAYEADLKSIPGLVAGADLSSDQFKFVRITPSGAILNAVNGGPVAGVLQGKPAALGRDAQVAYAGVTKVKSGAGFVKGVRLMSNALGLAIEAASSASAASKDAGNTGPYDLEPGDTMVLDTDNGGNETATFDAAAATVVDTTSYPVADQNGNTEKVTIYGYAEQTVTFSGTHTTAAQIAASMNAQLVGCSVAVDGGQVKITTDKKGDVQTVAIGTGTCGLTWDTPVAGTGDVGDIDAVTAAEVKALVEADTIAEVTVVGNGFTINSPTTGASSELDFKSGNCLAVFGLSVEVIVGQDSDSHYRGIALEAAGGANELTTMLLAPTGKY
jgi:hypothetical protein